MIIRRICDGRPLEAAVDEAITTVRREDDAAEVVSALELARKRAAVPADRRDVEALGQGWVAEEALAIAVHCALVHPGDLGAAVRLAANHSGDSDSTAAITGNIMGALLGVHAIPPRWLGVLELRDTIDRLATALHDRFVAGRRDVDWTLWNAAGELQADDPPAPPHDAYWVEPGRLLAGPYPGAGVKAERNASSTTSSSSASAASSTSPPARSRPANSCTCTAGAASGAPAPSSAAA